MSARIVTCPTCQKPVEWSERSDWRPFCSERCRMADLGRWLGGDYRIAAGPASDAPGTDEPPEELGAPEGPET